MISTLRSHLQQPTAVPKPVDTGNFDVDVDECVDSRVLDEHATVSFNIVVV